MTSLLALLALSVASCCQALPEFEHDGRALPNNSFIYYRDITSSDILALKCMTDNVDCCNHTSVGNWRDVRGNPVQEGRDGTSCLYVTREDGEIRLNRKSSCFDYTPGLWKCDIPDSSEDMQSLYVYISNDEAYGNHSKTIIFYTFDVLQASLDQCLCSLLCTLV